MSYSRTWNCHVCGERQESIDTPKLLICQDCLRPVARVLCQRGLGVDFDAKGVDKEYWMRQADAVISPMMRRARNRQVA